MSENNKQDPQNTQKKEILGFQTEVKQLLHLVTHALYSNKEIFLRELVSNASDAADKLRFEALAKPEYYENDADLKVWVDFNKDEGIIIIRDNGIGMSRDEVVVNLGTIAKSGTKDFLAALTNDQAKDAQLIGQFGVGFYSGFVVADKITVKTRRAGLPKEYGVIWESSGEGEFTVDNFEKQDRGTEIILHLKKEESEFLDYYRLSQIITKYSDHIMLPIVMKNPVIDKDKDKDKNKVAQEQEEIVNKATALWSMAKKDIKDDDYKALYRHLSHDFEDPLAWTHNQVEGKLEYTSLLYLPAHAPFDFGFREKKHGLKLYVKRVFILDNAEQLLPNYLRFVHGIVDSKDLPLNVSREILQSNRIIEQIKSGVVKRILDMLEKMATDEPEKYTKFLKAFGTVFKEGLVEDLANQDRIAKLLRFYSTKVDNADPTVSLDEYIKNMHKDQDKIYYITGEGLNAAKNCPHLEIFRQKGIEVLLLDERIDEWWLVHYHAYSGKNFQSIAKSDIDMSKILNEESDNKKEEKNKLKNDYESLLKRMQDVLKDQVKEVRLSELLTDSPVCIVTAENEMSYNLQRILASAGQNAPAIKPILEINPQHVLMQQLKDMADEKLFADWANLFYEQAVLVAGGKLNDAAGFVKRLNELLKKS
jgi:molecular chaperone HtpG